jgi:hypothetical protein
MLRLRSASRQAEGSTRRRRVSYANVAATLALVLALGAGAAWAKKHIHFIITSASQIKPSVRAALHGANGTNGAVGATGPTGVTGNVGQQGPCALQLNTGAAANTPTTAVGAIPVFLSCNEEVGVAQAAIDTTDVASGSFPVDTSGTFSTRLQNGTSGTTPSQFMVFGDFGGSSGTNLNGGGLEVTGDEQIGSILLTYDTENFPHYTDITETVDYDLTVGSGTGPNGSCAIAAQIVSSTVSGNVIV